MQFLFVWDVFEQKGKFISISIAEMQRVKNIIGNFSPENSPDGKIQLQLFSFKNRDNFSTFALMSQVQIFILFCSINVLENFPFRRQHIT